MVTAFTLAGCSALGSDARPEAPNPQGLELSSIKVAAIKSAGSGPLYLAVKEGFFEQEGLKVTPVTVGGGAAGLASVIGGSNDVVIVNDVSAIASEAKGEHLKFLADGPNAAPNTYILVAAPGGTVKTIHDLPGKKVGISSPEDIITLVLESTLKTENVDPDSIKYVPTPYVESTERLNTGLDAAVQTEPYFTQGQKAGEGKTPGVVIDLFPDNSPYAGMPIAASVATEKFTQDNPKTAAAYQRAMARADKLAQDQPSKIRAILADKTAGIGIDEDTSQLMILPSYPIGVNAIRVQRVADLMLEHGALKSRVDVSTMVFHGEP
jgi:NitT/TauT family transport system substrate-binding protein